MVDSVKNYGITGVSSTVELGGQGSVIDASNSSVIAIKDKDNDLINAAIAEGTDASHAVTKNQLDAAGSNKVSVTSATVNYNNTTVLLGILSANATILSTTVEPLTTWTDADANTNITVGDNTDPDRLFTGFDPSIQTSDEINHMYTSAEGIFVTVSQGGASAGTAKVSVFHSGAIDTSPDAGGASPEAGGGGDTRPTLNNFVQGSVFTPRGGTPTITDNTSYYTVTSPAGNLGGEHYYFPDNVAKTSGKWYYFMKEINIKFRPVLIKEAADNLGAYFVATDTTYPGGTPGINIIYIDIDNGELYVDKLDGTNTHNKSFTEPAGRRFYPGVSVENGTGVGEISFTSSYATPTSIRSGYSLWRG